MDRKKKDGFTIEKGALVGGLLVLIVGILIGATYATPATGVTHGVLDIIWGAIADDLTGGSPSYDPANFLRDLNAASDAQGDKWTGIDADTLDGLDSSQFVGSGGGGSGGYYAKRCTWVSYVDVDADNGEFGLPPVTGGFWPQDEMTTLPGPCTDKSGFFTSFPDDCDGGVEIGLDCYITGVSVVDPPIAEIHSDGQIWYIADGGMSSTPDGKRDYVSSGICQRICKG